MFYDRIPDWSPEDLAPFIENEETGEENRKLDAEIAQLEGEHAKLDAKYGQCKYSQPCRGPTTNST
jgi:hypothetical protein